MPLVFSTTAGGLRLRDVETGGGREAGAGDVVRVLFSGSLLSGAEGWSVGERGETFAIGRGNSAMWEEVAVGMRVGGRRTVLVPPSASLRPRKKGRALLAPPGETMRFECELRSIESGVTALAVRSGLLGVGSVAAPLALIALTNWLCCLLWAGLPQPADAAEASSARLACSCRP